MIGVDYLLALGKASMGFRLLSAVILTLWTANLGMAEEDLFREQVAPI